MIFFYEDRKVFKIKFKGYFFAFSYFFFKESDKKNYLYLRDKYLENKGSYKECWL